MSNLQVSPIEEFHLLPADVQGAAMLAAREAHHVEEFWDLTPDERREVYRAAVASYYRLGGGRG